MTQATLLWKRVGKNEAERTRKAQIRKPAFRAAVRANKAILTHTRFTTLITENTCDSSGVSIKRGKLHFCIHGPHRGTVRTDRKTTPPEHHQPLTTVPARPHGTQQNFKNKMRTVIPADLQRFSERLSWQLYKCKRYSDTLENPLPNPPLQKKKEKKWGRETERICCVI